MVDRSRLRRDRDRLPGSHGSSGILGSEGIQQEGRRQSLYVFYGVFGFNSAFRLSGRPAFAASRHTTSIAKSFSVRFDLGGQCDGNDPLDHYLAVLRDQNEQKRI